MALSLITCCSFLALAGSDCPIREKHPSRPGDIFFLFQATVSAVVAGEPVAIAPRFRKSHTRHRRHPSLARVLIARVHGIGDRAMETAL